MPLLPKRRPAWKKALLFCDTRGLCPGRTVGFATVPVVANLPNHRPFNSWPPNEKAGGTRYCGLVAGSRAGFIVAIDVKARLRLVSLTSKALGKLLAFRLKLSTLYSKRGT
jgi:hypothetical protein